MNNLIPKEVICFLLLLATSFLQGQVEGIKCYRCIYSKNNPEVVGSNKDCLGGNLEENDQTVGKNFALCYANLRFENDEIIAAYRGGQGISSLADSTLQDDSEVEKFVQYTCDRDLCNSQPGQETVEVVCNKGSAIAEMSAILSISTMAPLLKLKFGM